MNRRDMLKLDSCWLTVATGLIFLTTTQATFAQAVAELPVPLKRMIVTLPTPAATSTTGTPAGSATATPTGTLPSTVNVNLTPTDRVVTTTKTTAVWVPETHPPAQAPAPGPAAPAAARNPQAGTITKTVLNGTDECVTISDVASPAKQAQPATAAAMLYFERSLTTANSDHVFTVTVDGDVTIELVTVVAFDNETNRPIPLAFELKQGQQQPQTKCPLTTAICAPATAGQGGTGSSGTGTGTSGATGTTGTATTATKPPATLRITIEGDVPVCGGVLRVTAPSKQIHAGTVTYHATDKQRVWRQITIANGAQHSPQNTAGAQGGAQGGAAGAAGGAGNQGCGGANPAGAGQAGQAQPTALPPWTVGAEVVVLDPTGKTVVLKGKLGTPVLCDDLAVLDDAIYTLNAVMQAANGRPDKTTADAVLQKWKNEEEKSLVRATKLLQAVHAIEAGISDNAMNAVNVQLSNLSDPHAKIIAKPFQDLHDKIGKDSDGLKSISEVALFLDKLAALAKAAGDHNPTANNDAHKAATTTLKSGKTELENLRTKLTTFTNAAKSAIDKAIGAIGGYQTAQRDYQIAQNDMQRNIATAAGRLDSILDELSRARCGLADIVDHELTSVETVVQRLAVEIDADHKYVDLANVIGAPTNIGQLPRVVRLVNKQVALECDPCAVGPTPCQPCAVAPAHCNHCNLAAHCEGCASAPESIVIPAATVIYVDLPGCLRGTVTLAAALPPGPAPPDGAVGPGLPPNNYCGLTINEAFLNVAYLPVANTLDPGLRVLGASKKSAAPWLPLSAANGQLNYLQAEAFTLTTEPADNIAYFDSRAGQIALKLSNDPKSIWSVSTSVANLTIDNTADDWSTVLNAIKPNLDQLIGASSQPPTPSDPGSALAALCRLINLDPTAKAGLAKIPNNSPQVYFQNLNQKLSGAMAKAKAYDNLNNNESSATTKIALIHRQVRQLKNRRGRDDFNPRLLELEFERQDQHALKTDEHIRKQFIGAELLDVVGHLN